MAQKAFARLEIGGVSRVKQKWECFDSSLLFCSSFFALKEGKKDMDLYHCRELWEEFVICIVIIIFTIYFFLSLLKIQLHTKYHLH